MPRPMANTHALPASARPAAEHSAADLQTEVLSLFDELRHRLLRYAMSFGLSLHDGEDVLQEAFLALFRHLQLGRPRANLHGWLYGTTHNLSLKCRASVSLDTRRQQPVAEPGGVAFVPESADRTPDPEQHLIFHERQQRLWAVMQALPENDRVCLHLRADGLRYREIASVVGISLGSVAASLARSFERLRRTDAR